MADYRVLEDEGTFYIQKRVWFLPLWRYVEEVEVGWLDLVYSRVSFASLEGAKDYIKTLREATYTTPKEVWRG